MNADEVLVVQCGPINITIIKWSNQRKKKKNKIKKFREKRRKIRPKKIYQVIVSE